MEPMSPSMMERLKDNKIIQAWLVLMLAIFFGGSLAGMQLTLGPKIEENKINETRARVPELVLGPEKAAEMEQSEASLAIEPQTITVQKPARSTSYTVFEASAPEQGQLGWVVKASGQGYADKIELLLGLSPAADKVTGIFVLEQKETPGLGNKIVTQEWRSQFIGQETSHPLVVVKDGANAPAEIDSITGATISSRAVANIVNTAVVDLKGPLSAKTSGGK